MSAKSWIARLVDGPAADGVDRVFVVGPVWREIVLAPMPPTRAFTDEHWVIVGGSGIPHDDGDVPWAGEARYVLAEVADSADPIVERVALYRVAS